MKTRSTSIVRWLSLTFLLTVLLVPCLSESASAVTITVKNLASIGNGLDPADPAWSQAVQATVNLDTVISTAGVPLLLPSSKWRYLRVKAIRDATNIYFRYQWTDTTQDLSVGDAPLFADAVAMEIPFEKNGQPTPSTIAMGNQFEPVNIIFWRADLPHPQNIVAGGGGTVQTSPDSDGPPPLPPLPITHSQNYNAAAKTWTVVIKRPLSGAASIRGNMVDLIPRAVNAAKGYYRICFAQWDGGNQERNGVKLVAGNWQTLYIP